MRAVLGNALNELGFDHRNGCLTVNNCISVKSDCTVKTIIEIRTQIKALVASLPQSPGARLKARLFRAAERKRSVGPARLPQCEQALEAETIDRGDGAGRRNPLRQA